jgi:hypothetical protein
MGHESSRQVVEPHTERGEASSVYAPNDLSGCAYVNMHQLGIIHSAFFALGGSARV